MMVIMMLVVIVIVIVSTAGQTVKGTGVVRMTKECTKNCSKVKRTLEEECSSLKVKMEEIKQEQAHNPLCFFYHTVKSHTTPRQMLLLYISSKVTI